MKTAGAILRAGFRTDYSPSFPSHSGNGEVAAEREISGNVGVQFVYFNKDYSTKYFIGFLDSRGEYFQSSDIQLWELIFLKRFLSLPKTTVKSLNGCSLPKSRLSIKHVYEYQNPKESRKRKMRNEK